MTSPPGKWPPLLSRASAIRFAVLLLAALLLRMDTFGHPNLHDDEAWYFTVGNAMHQGALPYVDLWDRKPFGLFALYWLIAGISAKPIAYQLAATLFAAATAWTIGAMAQRWAGRAGALFAGLCYLFWLAPLYGFGGQSPVFYNLFVALAALLVLRGSDDLRDARAGRGIALAMLLGGIAITIKTTAFFEAAFLGLWCAALYWRSGTQDRLARLAQWALLGALPSLAIAGAYALGGYWGEFWHAMVTSNFAKEPDLATASIRGRIMFINLAPILIVALFGLRELAGAQRRFVLQWLGAALIGLAAFPNFYLHYALPLLVPLCLAASKFLDRWLVGAVASAAVLAMSFTHSSPLRFGETRNAIAAMDRLAAAIRQHGGQRGLLTYDAPPQLYALTGQRFLTPLTFPTHLSHLVERDVSHLSTRGEMARALAQQPGAIVMFQPLRNGPYNDETHAMVLRHVAANCRLIGAYPMLEREMAGHVALWGDCGANAPGVSAPVSSPEPPALRPRG